MRARILHPQDLPKLLDRLRLDYQVFAPFSQRGGDTFFDQVTDENRDRIQIHFANPRSAPKRFILPQLERLLVVENPESECRIEPTLDHTPRVIFGIRSCDLAAIGHLDRFYLGQAFRDPYYAARREKLFLVNFVCTDPERDLDDACFCVCTVTGPAARELFDLQLMDLGGEFLVLAGSPAGEALFSEPFFHHGTPEHLEKRQAILDQIRGRFKATTSWFATTVRYISRSEVLEKTWEEIGQRCLECGGCTYVCPACTCFTVSDRRIGPHQIERVRLWDSCALYGFTRMAGGFNPRRAVHDRRNRRFFRKLAHYFIKRELTMACVGCGRCAAVCHGDIGMPSVVEMIRRATALENHEPAAG